MTSTAGPAGIATRNLTYTRGDSRILTGISLTLPAGAVTALCGPNGSGKTTLLRLLAGQLTPAAGTVEIAGRRIDALSRRARAREVAVLPQHLPVPEGIDVRQLVRFGRHPHRIGWLGRGDPEPGRVDWAIAATGCGDLVGRDLAGLSGGERQRAWLAMALAQTWSVLLLDEPTTFLDVQHRIELMALVRRLSRDQGLTVVWVLHDLNEAAAFSDRIVLLRDGAAAADGTPAEVLTVDTLRAVFGVSADVVPHPRSGRPVFLPAAS